MATILLVDDDVTLLEHLANVLGEAGYTVVRANRVQYAELLIDEQRPDLIVLDPDIGSGDGWMVLTKSARDVPVIVISGQGFEEDLVRSLDAGAADFLGKPFGTAELLARMRARLRDSDRASLAAASADSTRGLPEPVAAATGQTQSLAQLEHEAPAVRAPRGARAPGDEAEPVFIPYGEEERILRETRAASAEDLGDINQLPLGQRLHAARQRKRLTLVQAELETRPSVPMHYIQAMEEEKFSLLPRGQVAESLLKTYATYVGVNVDTAVDEYRRLHYIAPNEPLAALGGSPLPRRLPIWAISLIAAMLALVIGCGSIWLYDPASVRALAQRAGILSSTPAPSAAP